MLLVKMTINSVVNYISNSSIAIEHYYESRIVSLNNLRVATEAVCGGYAAPTYGDMELLPNTFDGVWPPPSTCPIEIFITDEGEAQALKIFDGTAALKTIARDSVVYSLYGKSFNTKIDGKTCTGTLVEVFTQLCGLLSLTLNTTYARATPPAVRYTPDRDALVIDVANTLAEKFTHRFYIEGSTLYLVDCLLDNGPTINLTEFDIFPSSYSSGSKIKELTAKYRSTSIAWVGFSFIETNGGLVSAAEVKLFKDASSTQLTITGGGASSYTPGYEQAKAYDNNTSTYYASAAVPSGFSPVLLYFTFTGSPFAGGYSIQPGPGATEKPLRWRVYSHCLEAAAYKLYIDESTPNTWTAGEIREFTIPEPIFDLVVSGASPFGETITVDEFPHDSYSIVLSALTDMKLVMERPRIMLSTPLVVGNIPKIGQKITLTDESLYKTTYIWARAAAIVFDFDSDACIIEGEGNIS